MTLTSGAHPVAQASVEDEYAVRIEHVVKQFTADGPIVLDDVSLDVRPGEFVSLVGASGCGKSTLLNLISRPRQADLRHRSRPPAEPSFMFQEAALLPWLTAGSNVELALTFAGVPQGAAQGEGAGAARPRAPRRVRTTNARTSSPAACASASPSRARSPRAARCC